MSNLKQSNIWVIIGKFGVLLSVVWIIIQMINLFSKPKDFKMKIKGNHYSYSIAFKHQELIDEYKKILSLDKSYTKNVNDNGISIQKLKEFLESKKGTENYKFISDYQMYMDYKSLIDIDEYNEVWTFNISNTGNKPVDDLLIEIPFKGFYELNSQKGESSKGEFKDRIEVGNLAPGYSVNVIAWVNNIYTTVPEYIEEKTRITHKYGWEKISYPMKAVGIVAWNIRNDNIPLAFTIVVILLFLMLSFAIGADYGPKYQKKEKERKINELKELEKMKEEELKVSNEHKDSKLIETEDKDK
ncbi:hypothetical protein ACFLYJ_01805 [Candidatus Cloacimonadota bacterium]